MMLRMFVLVAPLLVAGVAHAKDPRAVRMITDELDRFERKITEGEFQTLTTDAWSLYQRFADVDDDLKSDAAYPALVKRWRELGIKAANAAGGHSKEILGDGTVPAEDEDRKQLYSDVEAACSEASRTSSTMTASDITKLKASYAKYEKALARALRADPASVRYKNGHFKLFACEYQISQLQMQFEDNPNHEHHKIEHYKACGYDEYVLRRLKMGARWSAWEVDGVPGKNGYLLDCKKHPKKSKLSGNMTGLVKAEFKYPGNAVWTIAGQPTTQQEGLRIYQYQSIRVYGKDITIATNDCGETDTKIVCAASGAQLVRAYNAMAHLSTRAEVHRAAGRADRCKQLYKDVRREMTDIWSKYEYESKRGDWDKTLKYKTATDGVMNESKLVGRMNELAEQADERSIGKYCAQP